MFSPAFGVHFQGDSLNVDWILSLEPLSAMIRIGGLQFLSATVPEELHVQLLELMRRPFPKDHELVARHIAEEERHRKRAERDDAEDTFPLTPAEQAVYLGCDCLGWAPTDVRLRSGAWVKGDRSCYDETAWAVTAPPPTYPVFAREAMIQGKVILRVLIGDDGRVKKIMVHRGITGLNDATVDAVRRWEFKPAQKSGAPVCIWQEIPVDFHF